MHYPRHGICLTFAMSAHLFPASRIEFSLRSSAGVHGMFARVFLVGGGPIGLMAIPDSSMPKEFDAVRGGPDIARFFKDEPDARLLCRASIGDPASGFRVGLAVFPIWGGALGSGPLLSPRLDILSKPFTQLWVKIVNYGDCLEKQRSGDAMMLCQL